MLNRYLTFVASLLVGHTEAVFRTAKRESYALLLSIAVGTPVTRCPPHRPGRALISASGSSLGFITAHRMLSAHSPTRGTRAIPLGVGYVSNGKVFSLSRSLPSSLSADDAPSLFE